MGTIEKLIEIYSRHQVDGVGVDPEYVNLCKENADDQVFGAQDRRVAVIKRKLEKNAGAQTSYQKQVKYALRILKQLVGSKDQEDEICIRLTCLTYYPNWTAKQKAYFDKTSALLRTSLDYFLSFTQRNQTHGGNPINSDHRYLIQSIGLSDPKDNPQNELARMLDTFLRISKYQFRGFFFPMHEDDSKQVAQKLADSLRRSLVFIQLVQNDMFSKNYPPEPNYCYDEYTQAGTDQKNIVFIFANGQHPKDLIVEEEVRVNFDEWYQFIRGADCVDMKPTRIAEQSANIEFNRDKLKERLVEKLQSFREALWESVPGDLD